MLPRRLRQLLHYVSAIAPCLALVLVPASTVNVRAQSLDELVPSTGGNIFRLKLGSKATLSDGTPTADLVLANLHTLWYYATPRGPAIPGSELRQWALVPPCRAVQATDYSCDGAEATIGRIPVRPGLEVEVFADPVAIDDSAREVLGFIWASEILWRVAFDEPLPTSIGRALVDLEWDRAGKIFDRIDPAAGTIVKIANSVREFPVTDPASWGDTTARLTEAVGEAIDDPALRAFLLNSGISSEALNKASEVAGVVRAVRLGVALGEIPLTGTLEGIGAGGTPYGSIRAQVPPLLPDGLLMNPPPTGWIWSWTSGNPDLSDCAIWTTSPDGIERTPAFRGDNFCRYNNAPKIERLDPTHMAVLEWERGLLLANLDGSNARSVPGIPLLSAIREIVSTGRGGPTYVQMWSPSSSTGSGGVYLLDLQAESARQVLLDGVDPAYTWSDRMLYEYSANKQRVLAAAARFPAGLPPGTNRPDGLYPRQTELTLFDSVSGSVVPLAKLDDLPVKVEASGRLTPQDSVQHVLSPDGRQLFFTTFVGQQHKAWIWHLESGQRMDLALTASEFYAASFSRSGLFLALGVPETVQSKAVTVFVIDVRTGIKTAVLKARSIFTEVAFAGGALFILDRPEAGGQAVLYQCFEDGSACKPLVEGDWVEFEDVPDSPFVKVANFNQAGDSSTRLSLARKDGSALREISRWDTMVDSTSGRSAGTETLSAMVLSPDARKAAVVTAYRNVGDPSQSSRLLVFDLEGPAAKPTEVVSDAVIFPPIWSPDGKYVTYTASSAPWSALQAIACPDAPELGLYVAAADGSPNPTEIAHGCQFALAWV